MNQRPSVRTMPILPRVAGIRRRGAPRREASAEKDPVAIAIFVVDEEGPSPPKDSWLGRTGSRILYANDAFLRMSGYSSEQLVGHSALLLAGARPRRENLETLIASRFPLVRSETKVRPDGAAYRVEVTLEALPRTEGHPQHVVLTQRMCG